MEVISDFAPDSSHFHHHHRKMRTGSGSQRSPIESYRRRSKARAETPSSPQPHPQTNPVPLVGTTTTPPSSATPQASKEEHDDARDTSFQSTRELPSPPLSSSSNPRSCTTQRVATQQNTATGHAFHHDDPVSERIHAGSAASLATVPFRANGSHEHISPENHTIKIRDLAHIRSFANDKYTSHGSLHARRRTADDPTLKYEISAMPITDIIEMVAGLLTKITTTNDRQHDNIHRSIPGDASLNLSGLYSSVLAFHGKNIPSITILSYLSRIHKYCPTTYEVFLSLLVYFDRMTERVNSAPMQSLHQEFIEQESSRPSTSYSAEGSDLADSPPAAPTPRDDPDLSDESDKVEDIQDTTQTAHPQSDPIQLPPSHFFVVDSFNIHRLVIASVTCASKFFSDVFYTNSRYAKVGGLPLAELNHLELQFLLLNDFRLSVPVEELEAYGTMLVEFYAREVASQRPASDQSYGEDTEMKGPTSSE